MLIPTPDKPVPRDSFRTRAIMPPPHLHPRSRMTSSLFATTVLVSFFVVALPHALPCPAPRVSMADGEMTGDGRRRRRRRTEAAETTTEGDKGDIVQFDSAVDEDGASHASRSRRECPVPKPGGILGAWAGFKSGKEESGQGRDRR